MKNIIFADAPQNYSLLNSSVVFKLEASAHTDEDFRVGAQGSCLHCIWNRHIDEEVESKDRNPPIPTHIMKEEKGKTGRDKKEASS